MAIPAAVLVVEDQPLIRMNASDLVRSAGFEALEAINADEAIQILESRTGIRLVFTDIEMPGTMDGLKLAHFIRGRWPKVHLMVASGKVMVKENQLPAGTKFFAKPYGNDTIIEEIRRLMALDSSSDGVYLH